MCQRTDEISLGIQRWKLTHGQKHGICRQSDGGGSASGQSGVISYDGTIRCISTEVSRKGTANVMTIDVVALQNVAERERYH